MRDDFPITTKETLAKRVGYRCSNPKCRQPTSGPHEDSAKALNVGVAAHITAASEGGPRFDRSLSVEQRRSTENAIWLCQNCAKLVDNDAQRYSVDVLRRWKVASEGDALRAVEVRGLVNDDAAAQFHRLEHLMPDLLAEMRKDLAARPLSREFVILKKVWRYWGRGHELVYYLDDHPELEIELLILQNHGLIRDITFNNVKRYIFTEEFVRYLEA